MNEKNKSVEKAKKILEEISSDERERYLAELRQKYIMDQKAVADAGYDKGVEQGIKQGREQGEKNKQLEQENNANTDTINDIKSKLTSTNEKIAQLTEENNKAGLEISNLEINSKSYTAEIEDLQNKIKELELSLLQYFNRLDEAKDGMDLYPGETLYRCFIKGTHEVIDFKDYEISDEISKI